MTKQDLSSVLWRERELLETLLYKLEVEQMVLASGRTQWLATAAREVEAILERIREIEILRAVELEELTVELGLPSNPSLSQLADECEEPWRTIWLDHRENFSTVTTAITQMSESNRELLTAGYHAAQATLVSLSDSAGTYGSNGTVDSERRSALLDRSL